MASRVKTFSKDGIWAISEVLSRTKKYQKSKFQTNFNVLVVLPMISFPSLCRFLELVRPGDGEEYSKTSFLGARIEKFMFIIITQQWNPPERLMDQTYPIRVIIPSRHDL